MTARRTFRTDLTRARNTCAPYLFIALIIIGTTFSPGNPS